MVFQKSRELLGVANNEEASLRSRQPLHENRFEAGRWVHPVRMMGADLTDQSEGDAMLQRVNLMASGNLENGSDKASSVLIVVDSKRFSQVLDGP